MRKTIAFYLPSLRIGGAERVVVNLANEFSRRGYCVDLVVGSQKGELADEVRDGININEIRTFSLPFYPSLGAIPGLIYYLLNNEPDWLYSAMNHINISVLLSWRISRSNTRLMISEHGSPTSLIRNSKKNRIVYLLAKYMYKWADEIVAVSNGAAEDLANVTNITQDKIHTIYNPIVTESLLSAASQSVDHPWFSSPDFDVVLGMGRLSPEKRFDDLLEAYSNLNRSNTKLVILGDGPERHNIENKIKELQIEEEVELMGYVREPYKFINSSSVFVLSSGWEGFGNVLVEALACGCPVVSTDCPNGPKEILDYGRYGILVPVGNIPRLTAAIDATLAYDHNRSRYQQRANDFRVENITDQYEQVMSL